MEGYVWAVMVLGGIVDYFLLLGTTTLAGYPPDYGRCLLAALIAGVHSGAAMLPGLYFLGNWLWRIVFFCIVCVVAFGMDMSALRKGVLFVLLRLALDGVGAGLGQGGFWAAAAGAVGLFVLCTVGFRGNLGKHYIPVELNHNGRQVHITALHDTGNTLHDPLTGQSVMVVGPGVAKQLTGLTREQLRRPAATMTALPGLRLIPYKTVGEPNGLLLALRCSDVKIGHWKGSCLVALAPEGLEDGEFQALTGGVV